MKFSKPEIYEIVKAWLAVSLVFAIAFGGFRNVFSVLPLALLTGGIGFLLHELAHKWLAQKYGCWAQFRAHNQMLLVGILLSFLGFIILAPGGVYIRGASRTQHGKIALAGPLMNILLAAAFFGLASVMPGSLALYGLRINAFLAVFNLIPFPPFDGHAAWQWSKLNWLIAMIMAGVLLIL